MNFIFRSAPNDDHGGQQHDGTDKSQEEGGENVGGGRGHVCSVLLPRASVELVEVRFIIINI